MSSSDAIIYGEVIAHSRVFTDIEFAKDIARLANTYSRFKEFEAKRNNMPELTARYEIRHKSVSSIAIEYGNNHILEIASGLSGRGIQFTSEDNISYIETDFTNVISQKREVIEQILKERNLNRPNLYFKAVDALNYNELFQIANLLPRPLTIICEGLLSNLPYLEVKTATTNIRDLLVEFGGVFITPDFYNSNQRQQSMANEDHSYTFKTDAEIYDFISDLGLNFERYLQIERVKNISCSLNFDRETLQREIQNRYVYKLRIK